MPGTAFETVTPILRVTSLAISLDYYVKALGFHVDWRNGWFASVSRGRCHIFLSQGDQGNPGGWLWLGVENVEALFQEFQATGAKVRHPPTNYQWACEMQVEDPDRNVLRIGSESKPDQPFGEWMDMRGDRWVSDEAGGWTRVDRTV